MTSAGVCESRYWRACRSSPDASTPICLHPRRHRIIRHRNPNGEPYTVDLQLEDKTALVTGASVGIGRAIAKGLALEGARIAVAARRGELLESLVQEIEALGGPR